MPPTVTRLGVVLGLACGLPGFVVAGPEHAVLLALVGYFLGESIRSVYWSVAGEPRT